MVDSAPWWRVNRPPWDVWVNIDVLCQYAILPLDRIKHLELAVWFWWDRSRQSAVLLLLLNFLLGICIVLPTRTLAARHQLTNPHSVIAWPLISVPVKKREKRKVPLKDKTYISVMPMAKARICGVKGARTHAHTECVKTLSPWLSLYESTDVSPE